MDLLQKCIPPLVIKNRKILDDTMQDLADNEIKGIQNKKMDFIFIA